MVWCFLTEEVKMRTAENNKGLFLFHDGRHGGDFIEYCHRAEKSYEQATIAVLLAEVARHGEEIAVELNRMSDFLQLPDWRPFNSVEEYITKMHVSVPIFDPHPHREAIRKEIVLDALKQWGFDASRIEVIILKKKRRLRRRFYYKISFAVKVN